MLLCTFKQNRQSFLNIRHFLKKYRIAFIYFIILERKNQVYLRE